MNFKSISILVLSLGLSLGACASDDDNDDDIGIDEDIDLTSTLTIDNQSSFAFIEINLSSVDAESWEEDLLGSDILTPGESVEISGIECDDYDVRVVDEDQDECIVREVDLCLNDEHWVIDDAILAVCVDF